MNNNLRITKSIQIHAGKHIVWDVLTNPEKIKLYLFGTETISDWKAGSSIIFQGEYQGQHYKDKGKILEIRNGQILKYSYWSGFSGMEDKPENYSIITLKIDTTDNISTLTLSQVGFQDEKAQQHTSDNWGQVLIKIKEIAEQH